MGHYFTCQLNRRKRLRETLTFDIMVNIKNSRTKPDQTTQANGKILWSVKNVAETNKQINQVWISFKKLAKLNMLILLRELGKRIIQYIIQ